MSYAPGAGLPIAVAYALSALVVGVLAVVPGLGLALGLGRRSGWDLTQTAGAAFAFTLAGVGAVTLTAHYVGVTLTASLFACAALSVAGWVGGSVLGRGRRLASRIPDGLALGGLAAVAAVVEGPWFSNSADTFYHLAAIRSLLVTDRPVVTDPFYGTALRVIDPTSGVWHSALAAMARVTRLDPLWLWPGAVAVGAGATLLAFWVLCRRVGATRPAAAVATVAFGMFGLQLDMRWFGYPNRMSLALVFLALAGIVALMERAAVGDAALTVAAGFAAISLHLASAAVLVSVAFFAAMMLVVAAVVARARGGDSLGTQVGTLALTGALLAAVSLAVLLPKAGVVARSPLVGFAVEQASAQTVPLPGGLAMAAPSVVGLGTDAFLIGLLLAAVAAVPAFRDGDRQALAVLAVGAFPAVVLLDPPLTTLLLRASPYLTTRVAAMLSFTVFLAIAWGLSQVSRPRVEGRVAAALAALGLVAVALAAGPTVAGRFLPERRGGVLGFPLTRGADVRLTWGADVLGRLAGTMGAGYPVVAGDLESTYELAGMLPVSVLAAPPRHSPLAAEAVDGPVRRRDLQLVMDPATAEAARRSVLVRRQVGYVVVSTRAATYADTLRAFRAEPDLLAEVPVGASVAVFRVRR